MNQFVGRVSRKITEPTAARPTTMATRARIVSSVLMRAPPAATGAGRGAGALGVAGRGAAGAADARETGAATAAGAALGAATGAGEPAPVGPPGGRVGSLIVGAAVGLGGRLIRTVSFFGWTLPVSFFGGNAPPGGLGMFSAIKFWASRIGAQVGLSNSYSGRHQNRPSCTVWLTP